MLEFYRPNIFKPYTNLVAGESTRLGGISPEPYASLNLGLNTNDDPENVAKNRALFFDKLGINTSNVASSYQCHGSAVFRVDKAPQHLNGYDALITNQAGCFLTITIADCAPILIYDPKTEAMAAIHAGWRGTIAEIVSKTIEVLQQEYHCLPKDCLAYVGSCIDTKNFEVGPEVAQQFGDDLKMWDAQRGKYLVDLKKANTRQLLQKGIPESNIEVSPYSTFTNNDRYFSYRKEGGETGRMLALIGGF